ncbi:unnamed protein product [Schistocephalus solidus]|uniref:Reverse transcriptase domain-containing protein n=1 Tax=Schistocephalus solidus TaxID=70667 RepID=A0A183SDQ4_SCHSO|nr:unnamed protein product [Schistocephalus solidus]
MGKYLKVLINGNLVRLQLDPTSDITLTSKRTWHMIGRSSTITSNKNWLNVSGGTLHLKCELEFDVSFDGIYFRGTCYLTNCPNLNLLGFDWIEKLGLMELQLNLDQELEHLRRDGVLQPVNYSVRAAPIVAVSKATGKVRIWTDFSTCPNAALDTHQYPLPMPEDLFSKFNWGCCFAQLHLSDAYLHIETAPDFFQQTVDTMLQRLETILSRIQGYGFRPHLDKRIFSDLL